MTGANRWVAFLGLGLVGLLVGAALIPTLPAIGNLLVGLSGFGLAAYASFFLVQRLQPRDRYDLAELRRLEEAREMERILDEEVAPGEDQVVCPLCGQAYASRFQICPHCRVRP